MIIVSQISGTLPRLVFSCCLLLITLLITAPLTADTPPVRRTLIAAVPADFPPTYYRDATTGKPSGFAIEVMNEIAHRAGFEIDYVFGKPWDELHQMVISGKADLIPNLVQSKDREKLFIFSEPVESLPINLIVRSHDRTTTTVRPGMKMGVLSGSSAHSLYKGRTDIVLVSYTSLQHMLFDLLSGQLDIILTATPNIIKLAMNGGVEDRVRIIEPAIIDAKRSIALRHSDTELLKKLDAVIVQFVGSDDYRKIYEKWWGKPQPYWSVKRIVLTAASVLAVIIVLMGWIGWLATTRLNSRLQTALAQTEQERSKLRATIDATPDLIFFKDLNGVYLGSNPAFAHFVGKAVDELPGTTDHAMFPKDLADFFKHQDQLMLSTGASRTNEEWVVYPDGSRVLLETIKSPMRQTDGTIIGLVGVARDITERKRLEETLHEQTRLLESEMAERQATQEELADKQKQLEVLNRSLEERITAALTELRQKDQMLIQQGRLSAMGEMLSNIAHQWRQPLNNIALIIQNLQYDYSVGEMTDDEMERTVTSILEIAQYMSKTIDDFRNFFHQERETREFSVIAAVERSLSLVKTGLDFHGITVRFEKNDDVNTVGYSNEYAQVLLNIINNARDALLERKIENPQITISISKHNGKSQVTISDNAGGIADNVMARIFDPYFTTKDKTQGTGIGLYMAKMIIEQNMGGSLTARNTALGAEFRVEV